MTTKHQQLPRLLKKKVNITQNILLGGRGDFFLNYMYMYVFDILHFSGLKKIVYIDINAAGRFL